MAERKSSLHMPNMSAQAASSRPSDSSRQALPSSKPLGTSPSPVGMPKMRKPLELIEDYVSKGMDRNAASEKVIEDLQKALQATLHKFPIQHMMAMDKSFRKSAANLDAASKRIYDIEAKLDAKPGIVQVFAAGVAAGAILQTATKSMPLILGAVNETLTAFQRALKR